MTSKLTRERVVALIAEHSYDSALVDALEHLLAAMDSEPVAYISKSDFDAGYPHILARRDFNKACTMAVYAAQPAPVVPDEMTSEQAYEVGDYHGDPVDVFARGANWMRQHIIYSTLAVAPQEVK